MANSLSSYSLLGKWMPKTTLQRVEAHVRAGRSRQSYAGSPQRSTVSSESKYSYGRHIRRDILYQGRALQVQAQLYVA